MSLPLKKVLPWCVPLVAVAAGLASTLLPDGIEDQVHPILGLILGTLPYWLPVVLGYLSPRLFWLSAVGFLVGPVWSETRPSPPGIPGDGFGSPLAALMIFGLLVLPVTLGLTGAGALIRVIVRRFRAKRRAAHIKSIS